MRNYKQVNTNTLVATQPVLCVFLGPKACVTMNRPIQTLWLQHSPYFAHYLKSIKTKTSIKLTNRPDHFSSQIISKISQIICETLSTTVLCRYDLNSHFSKLQPRYRRLWRNWAWKFDFTCPPPPPLRTAHICIVHWGSTPPPGLNIQQFYLFTNGL